ncbi:hypothetical protein KJ359_000711 [Pestalotiopsis sp. 9143b]|nr:hypothetical protein KJ359_000711 [Pestalotiopsis sp. 9143b]
MSNSATHYLVPPIDGTPKMDVLAIREATEDKNIWRPIKSVRTMSKHGCWKQRPQHPGYPHDATLTQSMSIHPWEHLFHGAYLDGNPVRRGQKVQFWSGNGGDSFTQLPVTAFVSREWRAESLRRFMMTTIQGRSRYTEEKELAPTVVNPAGDLFFLRTSFHGAYPASVRVMLSEAQKAKSSLVVSRFRLQQITMSVPRHNQYTYNRCFPESVMFALYAAFKIIGDVGGQFQWLQPGARVKLSEAQKVAVLASTVLAKREYHSGAVKQALAPGGILSGLKEVHIVATMNLDPIVIEMNLKQKAFLDFAEPAPQEYDGQDLFEQIDENDKTKARQSQKSWGNFNGYHKHLEKPHYSRHAKLDPDGPDATWVPGQAKQELQRRAKLNPDGPNANWADWTPEPGSKILTVGAESHGHKKAMRFRVYSRVRAAPDTWFRPGPEPGSKKDDGADFDWSLSRQYGMAWAIGKGRRMIKRLIEIDRKTRRNGQKNDEYTPEMEKAIDAASKGFVDDILCKEEEINEEVVRTSRRRR